MIISKPQLPPINGYVEIEVNGKRVYKKIDTELDQKVTALETSKADKTDVENIWDELAAAYTEGVNSI